jgi:tRNA wybutosine-synthesizing protein 2
MELGLAEAGGRLAVRIRKAEAELTRRQLLRLGLLDRERKILRRGDAVEIPVVGRGIPGLEYVLQEEPVYYRPRLSFEAVKEALRPVLGEKVRVLRRWELIGDVVVVSLPQELGDRKHEVGRKFLEFFPRAKTVVNRRGIVDTYRSPVVEVIAGDGTETIHRENGCRFKLDVGRVMFSAGNLEERRRMAYISNPGEVVLDMFAGIGQFTIPVAKHSKPKKVVSIEKNPVAFEYLWENVKLNGLTNVEALLGDCREKSPCNEVDRVVMGYLFNTSVFLPFALKALRDKGVVHYHELVERGGEKRKEAVLKQQVERLGYEAVRIKSRKVKSYSPRYHHLVFDMEVRR